MNRLLAIFILVALVVGMAPAQTVTDSVKVYFRLGHSLYDPLFRSNQPIMCSFLDSVCRHKASADIERIVVRSYASPDGTAAANERLSVNRCKTITNLILSETGIDPTLLRAEPGGIAWDELVRMVEVDTRVPRRTDVLRVLRDTPATSRLRALKMLHGGAPYRWLYNNVFPELRNVLALLFHIRKPIVAQPDIFEVCDTVPAVASDTIASAVGELAGEYVQPSTTAAVPAEEPWYRLAIKSNLLYDAILMPSLEIEYRFNDKWTVNLEGVVPWWHNDHRHKYYQIMILTPEVRYWFKHYNNRPWHGMYVGLLGGRAVYDLENGYRGYKGSGLFAGVSFGFMFPVRRNLSFEAGLGVGYLNTRYEEYIPFEGHYVYEQTKRSGYVGPLKLKFAIVWHLWDIKKNKKGANAL